MTISILALLIVAATTALTCWKNHVRRQRQDAIRREAWRKMEAFHGVQTHRTLLMDLAAPRSPQP